jgi:hypothetical protein
VSTGDRNRTDEPLGTLARRDAARVIRALGARIVKLYGSTGSKPDGATSSGSDEADDGSGWGTKQRGKLLLALITEVAENADRCGNAALSATDAAVERFSRRKFKEGITRSHRDRAPITKNIDKMVGGWLRQFGRLLKQDAILATARDDVELEASKRRCFRMTLELRYPWRLIKERRLTISVRFEEVEPGGFARPLAFTSDPSAPEVALLASAGRRYGPRQEQQVEHAFRWLQLSAEEWGHDELAAFANRGLHLFGPKSIPKVLIAVFAAALAVATVAGAVEWVAQWMNADRLKPKITVSCDPKPTLLMAFPSPPAGGVIVEKNGVRIPIKNGVAIDEQPVLGAKNTYSVRAARTIFARYQMRVSAEMPACAPAVAGHVEPLHATLSLPGRTGTFNLTVDKTALGDPPSVWPEGMVIDSGHADEHLDPFVARDCKAPCQFVLFRCYFGLVEGADVQVTIDYGDSGGVQTFHSGEAVSPSSRQVVLDRPLFMRVRPSATFAEGDVYSLHVVHYYPKEGSYLVTASVRARHSPKEPYQFAKELQRRVRVGTVATVEMTESYRLPETHSVAVPEAPRDK